MTRMRMLLYILFYITVVFAILFVRLVLQPRYAVNYSSAASDAPAAMMAVPDSDGSGTAAAWTVPG